MQALLLSMTILLSGSTGALQQPPDFSGRWLLTHHGEHPPQDVPHSMDITQRTEGTGTTITVKRDFGVAPEEQILRVGNKSGTASAERTVEILPTWDDTALRIHTLTYSPPRWEPSRGWLDIVPVEQVETWRLTNDDKLVVTLAPSLDRDAVDSPEFTYVRR